MRLYEIHAVILQEHASLILQRPFGVSLRWKAAASKKNYWSFFSTILTLQQHRPFPRIEICHWPELLARQKGGVYQAGKFLTDNNLSFWSAQK